MKQPWIRIPALRAAATNFSCEPSGSPLRMFFSTSGDADSNPTQSSRQPAFFISASSSPGTSARALADQVSFRPRFRISSQIAAVCFRSDVKVSSSKKTSPSGSKCATMYSSSSTTSFGERLR